MALVVTFADAAPIALPGGEGLVNVEVTNLGEIVEQVRVEVLGPVGGYTTVEPGELHLYPGTAGTVLLRVKPFAGHMPGPVPFAVRAASTLSGDFTIEEAVLQVGAQTAFSADLRPRQSRARRRAKHRVTVFNDGNAPVTVRLAATDPDELLLLKMADTVTIQPGGAAVAKLSAKVMAGSPGDIHQFKVFLEDGVSPSVTLDGSVRTRRTAKWPFVMGVALVGALIAVVVMNKPDPAKTGAIELAATESTTTTVAGAAGAATTVAGAPAAGAPGAAPGAPGAPAAGGGGAPAAAKPAAVTTAKPTPAAPPPAVSSPPASAIKPVATTGTTVPLARSQRSAADKLLAAWAANNPSEMSKYATGSVVTAMMNVGPQAGAVTTSDGPGVNVDCKAQSTKGAKVLNFGTGQVATSVTFCNGTNAS